MLWADAVSDSDYRTDDAALYTTRETFRPFDAEEIDQHLSRGDGGQTTWHRDASERTMLPAGNGSINQTVTFSRPAPIPLGNNQSIGCPHIATELRAQLECAGYGKRDARDSQRSSYRHRDTAAKIVAVPLVLPLDMGLAPRMNPSFHRTSGELNAIATCHRLHSTGPTARQKGTLRGLRGDTGPAKFVQFS